MRADLLALTPDDLASFSNRGLTRRAEQEINAGTLTCEIEEDSAGTVSFRWSDQVECRLPAGARLVDSRCSCPSTTLCRHVLRSIFAYQRQHARPTSSQSAPLAAPVDWNPGTLEDPELAKHYLPAEFARWQREFASGHVIQVWTGTKPRAFIHTLGCTVNFLVPHEPRYATCDCAAEAPCGHVVLAVSAFRLLAPGASTALVSTATQVPPAPSELLAEIERDLTALAGTGLARSATLQVDRWRRLAERAHAAQLVWPAEVLHELADAHAAYLARDARFDPREFVALLAELLQRLNAIGAGRTPVPPLFVRGSARDRETEFGSARLVGVGCSVQVSRTATEISAHLQDSDSGAITAITRRFPHATDPATPPPPPRSFAELARAIALKGASFAAIGRGQLLVKGGRRTPSGRFVPGRAAASVAPQAYAWESLRAPLRATGFAEVRERLSDAVPEVLGPRLVGSRLAVCPVVRAEDVRFDTASQWVTARLLDPHGDSALLAHPYTSRAAPGFESLLQALRASPQNLRFVSGQARTEGASLVLAPLAVVFDDGGRRSCIQPWVDERASTAAALQVAADTAHVSASLHPLHDYLDELLDNLAERWLLGSTASATTGVRLASLGAALGLHRLADLSRLEQPERLLELTIAADFAFREFPRI